MSTMDTCPINDEQYENTYMTMITDNIMNLEFMIISSLTIAIIYMVNYMYNYSLRNDVNNDEETGRKPKLVHHLVGLFEIIKTNEDATESESETRNFAIGNFLNISQYPLISARDYITFISRFLRDEFKFNKYRIVSLSLNNGAYSELYTSMQSKKVLGPITAFFKAFNSTHYYMKLNYDMRIVDMFHDIYPAVIYDNKYAILELNELKKAGNVKIKVEETDDGAASAEASSLATVEPEIKPE